MMKHLVLLLLVVSTTVSENFGQRLMVSKNHRFLITEAGDPFFWMADTAWELFHRCDRDEVDMYLTKRAQQGFNVIQAVALAEIDGLNDPNPYGHVPLLNNDPTTPNEDYFEHVDYVISKAQSLGIYIALLPTWGDKVFKNRWGKGPEIFNTGNAKEFGSWIGNRYQDRDNIVWIIGGDRNPRPDTEDVAVWRALAMGIVEGAGGYDKTLMSFHPQPKDSGGSSTWFHQDDWLDFNMHQTGHCADRGTYKHIEHDYALSPVKPVVDGEPLYEDHPNCFKPDELGHSVPEDIRRIMYWNVFAGAFGQTYGCHDVWQMYKQGREGINRPLRPWPEALDLPMANQVRHLKSLMLSRPFLARIPDQSIIIDMQPEDNDYVIATRDQEGSYAIVYFPTGKSVGINTNTLDGDTFTSWWFDPRTGAAFKAGELTKANRLTIEPPSSGIGNDWVLVIDSQNYTFPTPGQLTGM